MNQNIEHQEIYIHGYMYLKLTFYMCLKEGSSNGLKPSQE